MTALLLARLAADAACLVAIAALCIVWRWRP